jgi:hypothetical protein
MAGAPVPVGFFPLMAGHRQAQGGPCFLGLRAVCRPGSSIFFKEEAKIKELDRTNRARVLLILEKESSVQTPSNPIPACIFAKVEIRIPLTPTNNSKLIRNSRTSGEMCKNFVETVQNSHMI